jgi:hypothetical protein
MVIRAITVAGISIFSLFLVGCQQQIGQLTPSTPPSGKTSPSCTTGRLTAKLIISCAKEFCGFVTSTDTATQIVKKIVEGAVPGGSTADGIAQGVCQVVTSLPSPAAGVTLVPPTYAGVVVRGHFVQ